MLVDHFTRSHDGRYPRQWTEKAVALAMANRWEEAAALNRRILAAAPEDISTLNRLGHALIALGRYQNAHDVYTQALALSPSNAIAEKNLARLAGLREKGDADGIAAKVDPKMFVAEPGKTAITSIRLNGKAVALAGVVVGEQVSLAVNDRALQVHDARGTLLGSVEPRLGHRIIELMNGGNRYDAALVSASEDVARIVIRETYQDASQAGKVSFPAQDDISAAVGRDDDEEEESLSDGDDGAEEGNDSAARPEEEVELVRSRESDFLE